MSKKENIIVVGIFILLFVGTIGVLYVINSDKYVYDKLSWNESLEDVEKDYDLQQTIFTKEFEKQLPFIAPWNNMTIYKLPINENNMYGEECEAIFLFFNDNKLIRILFVFPRVTIEQEKETFNNILTNINVEDYELIYQGNIAELKQIAEEKNIKNTISFSYPLEKIFNENGEVLFKDGDLYCWENDKKERIFLMGMYKNICLLKGIE